MNTKKNFLFLILGLLMTFLLPNYVNAATTFSAIDTQGKLLNFGNGNAPASVTTSAGKLKGATHKYLNVYRDPATGTVVDAIVTIDDLVNGTLTHVDNPSPNPTAKVSSKISGTTYNALGGSVPQGAIFSPWLDRTTQSEVAYVDFTISFVTGAAQTPVVLKNVYNNSLDIESVEYNAYGGFSSYTVSGDPDPLAHIVGTADGTKIRFSSVDCAGDSGLYIKDQSRVQAKFDTITSLKLRLGQFPDGTVPDGNGGIAKITRIPTTGWSGGTNTGNKRIGNPCTNFYPSAGSVRAYGAIFIKDSFTETTNQTIEITAPTVDLLTTSDTTPTVTGSIGGIVSATAKGSAVGTLGTTDSFTVKIDSTSYTPTITGLTWTVNVATVLSIGSHEIEATRNGVLVDQSSNELVIITACTGTKVWDSATSTCLEPSSNSGKVTICHSGNGKHYAKILIAASGMNGHETHEFDKDPDANGLCPGEVLDCSSQAGTVANAAGTACITPVAPTVTSTNSTDLIAVPISGGATTSNTILSVTLTKIKDGLGATVTGASPSTIGTNLTVTNNAWTVTSGAVAVGTYTITAKDGNNLSGTGTFTVECLTGKVATATACITPVAPTVTSTNSTDLIAVPISGGATTSSTISSVTLTKIKDGLGATVTGATPLTIGTNLTVTNNAWTVSSGAVAVGTYTITAKDGNNLSGTGTFTVECLTGKVATATACITPVAPTVTSTNSTDLIPVPISGGATTSSTISSVTLTKIKDGLGATVTGASPSTIGTNLSVTNNAWTVTSGAVAVGTYTITAKDGNNLSGTGTFTVTCLAGKVATATACTTIVVPTISCATTTDHVAGICKGNVGTSTALTITIAGTNVFNASITPVVANGTWTYTAPILAAGTYSVTVNGTNGVAPQTGTLVVTASLPPVVTPPASTTESVPVDIHGTFGTSTTMSSVVLTKVGSTPAVTITLGALILDAPTNNWKVSSGTLTVGSYTIVATDSNLLSSVPVTLTVTCADSKTANFAGDSCISAPTVTASQIFSTTTPVITGTVGSTGATGDPVLGASEAFKVVVNGVTYTYRTDAALTVTGTAWTLTIPAATPLTAGQSYPVVATRDGTLSGNGTITINGAPSVDAHPDTYDTTPILTGTVGTTVLGSDTFSVKINNQTYPYTVGVTTDGHVIVNADLTWRLTIPTASKLPAATYTVEAIRNTLTGTGSIIIKPCALPSVVNELADTCSLPVPTVSQSRWDSNTKAARTITGTVGDVALGADELFTVTISGSAAYNRSSLSISGLNWTLTIPTSTVLGAGTYSVEAARNTTAKNTDAAGKLVITLVCDTGFIDQGGACISQALLPTVNSQPSTSDTTPVITGTVGNSALGGNDTFTVTVGSATYQSGDGHLIVSGTSWALTIPFTNALTVGTHTITATRNVTSGTGSITITDCASPKILDAAGHCVDGSRVPTVNVSSSHSMSDAKIIVSGTVGDVGLAASNDSFNVTVTEHGDSTHTLAGALLVTGVNWTFELTQRATGTFDVNAVRNTDADTTDSELQIGIQVCELPAQVDKTISVAEWDSSKYVLGTCDSATAMANMPPPLYPDPQPERVSSTSEDCTAAEGGGKRSTLNVEQATIKRAKIINATTQGGTTTETLNDVVILYGEKTAGTMDISHAQITNNVATAVTLTGVTLNNVYIDMTGSFDLDTGEFTPPESSIDVSGGITNPSGTGSPNPKSTIIDGIITTGVSAGNPVRGRVVEGRYDVPTTTTSLTKGRRVMGTLTGATITGATTTTAKMTDNSIKTVIQGGTIQAGASLAITSVFGTVVNAKIENANIIEANHCFSSGTVGARGQLNWKEVITE